jgi:two-component system KDP operon response regulator KdpE
VAERILIVEDDNELGNFMCWQLGHEGYQVHIVKRAADGLIEIRKWRPDLVLLDIMMPDMDGWEACQRIREVSDVPIIFTTALGTEKDVVRGLELGADDYLVKPFGPKELTARIRAVLRRQRPTGLRQHIYRNGAIIINLDKHTVEVQGNPVELTPIEFKLLACLIDHEGRVVTHDYLLNEVWGQDYKDARHYLKLYIWYLRQKLETDPTNPQMILTQRGVGYRLVRTTGPEQEQAASTE